MAGRLEPVVHSWIKWVTWGIVITIERKANGLFVFLRLNGLCWVIAVLLHCFACAYVVNFIEYLLAIMVRKSVK